MVITRGFMADCA